MHSTGLLKQMWFGLPVHKNGWGLSVNKKGQAHLYPLLCTIHCFVLLQGWMDVCLTLSIGSVTHTSRTCCCRVQDLPDMPEWELVFKDDGTVDRRRYNAPTAAEVAGFMPGRCRCLKAVSTLKIAIPLAVYCEPELDYTVELLLCSWYCHVHYANSSTHVSTHV